MGLYLGICNQRSSAAGSLIRGGRRVRRFRWEARTISGPVDPEGLREVLTRAIGKICPRWLASDREDMVQNACVRVLNKIRRSEESLHLETSYLWKVAHSVVMDEIRRRARRLESGLEDAEDPVQASGRPSPEGEQEAGRLREAIAKGLAALGPPRRHAVLLFLQGFSLQESARILGWNAKRVDNQRYKGLAQLRSFLQEKGWRP